MIATTLALQSAHLDVACAAGFPAVGRVSANDGALLIAVAVRVSYRLDGGRFVVAEGPLALNEGNDPDDGGALTRDLEEAPWLLEPSAETTMVQLFGVPIEVRGSWPPNAFPAVRSGNAQPRLRPGMTIAFPDPNGPAGVGLAVLSPERPFVRWRGEDLMEAVALQIDAHRRLAWVTYTTTRTIAADESAPTDAQIMVRQPRVCDTVTSNFEIPTGLPPFSVDARHPAKPPPLAVTKRRTTNSSHTGLMEATTGELTGVPAFLRGEGVPSFLRNGSAPPPSPRTSGLEPQDQGTQPTEQQIAQPPEPPPAPQERRLPSPLPPPRRPSAPPPRRPSSSARASAPAHIHAPPQASAITPRFPPTPKFDAPPPRPAVPTDSERSTSSVPPKNATASPQRASDPPPRSAYVERLWMGDDLQTLGRVTRWSQPETQPSRGLLPRHGRVALRPTTPDPDAWLADGRTTTPDAVVFDASSASASAKLVAPAVVVVGSFELDVPLGAELEALRAAMRHLGKRHKSIAEALDAAADIEVSPLTPVSVLRAAIDELLAGAKRAAIAPAKLRANARESLVRARRYNVLDVLGGEHVVARWHTASQRQPWVAYLPKEAAAALPLLPKFEARAAVTLHPRQDPTEPRPRALAIHALARVIQRTELEPAPRENAGRAHRQKP